MSYRTILASCTILICIMILVIVYNVEYTEFYETSIQTRDLTKDGFCVLHSPEYMDSDDRPSSAVVQDTLACLPEGYQFLDYSYEIHGGSLSTFHRDVTSSSRILGCRNPTYTLIVYKCEGELLSVCPGSHLTFPFVWSHIVTIYGSPGTTFLFDCDVLHAGTLTICEKRWAMQYKICHIDDYAMLSATLDGIHTRKLGQECMEKGWRDYLLRKLSYYFEFPINYGFYPLMQRKYDGIMGRIQELIPVDFYNNV